MNIGQKIELMKSGGSIPGIPSGFYYIVQKDANGRISISETQNGPPLIPTGQPIGSPSFRLVSDFEYAFPLENLVWLNLSLDEFLKTTRAAYLSLDLI